MCVGLELTAGGRTGLGTAVLLLALVYFLRGVSARRGSDLIVTGSTPTLQRPPLPCSVRNKCNLRGNLTLELQEMNCMCDNICEMYDDCCKDFRPSVRHRHKIARGTLDCQRDDFLYKDFEVYIVNRCPRGYNVGFIKANCEEESPGDTFLHLPVSGATTRVLYRNYYCALCAEDTDILFWKPEMTCGRNPLEDQHDASNFTEVAKETLDQSFSRPSDNRCSVTKYTHPQNADLKPRRCKANLNKCDRAWKDKAIEKKCKGQATYAYVELLTFKNKYCGMCNFVNETYLTCEDKRTPIPPPCPWGDCDHPPPDYIPPPLAILLDLNIGSGSLKSSRPGTAGTYDVTETVVETRSCPIGQVYDPFTEVCRVIFCPNGKEFKDGRCLAAADDPNDLGAEQTTITTNEDHEVGERTSTTARLNVAPETTTPDSYSELITDGETDNGDKDYTNAIGFHTPPLSVEIHRVTTTQPVIYTTNPSLGEDLEITGENGAPTEQSQAKFGSNEDTSGIKSGNIGTVTLDCPMVAFNKTEYYVLKNQSIFIVSLGDVYHRTEYILSGTSVFVCAPFFQREYNVSINVTYTVIMFKFSRIQSLLSLIGMLISLVALFILLVIFMMLPPLRNIPGKCVISLAVALFFAQALFLIGTARQFTEFPVICLIFGAAMHYFFLVSFFWMNVLAIDISRTFITAPKRSQGAKGGSRLAAYSLYAWLVPALIVGAGVALDFYGDEVTWLETLRPYYGDGVCWITKRQALFYLFAAPLALLMCINIVLFCVTIKYIVGVTRAAKAALKQDKEKSRFVLYIKLTFIMGLTWIFGFLAALTDLHLLWYVFIVLNTLQGAFICFAFVCTRKVFRLLSEKGRVHRSSDGSHSNHHNGRGRYGNNYQNTRYGQYTRPTQYFETQSKVISQETSI